MTDRAGARAAAADIARSVGGSGATVGVVLLVLPDWPMQFDTYQALEAACEVLDKAGRSPIVYTHRAAGQARPLWELLEPDAVLGFGLFSADDLASMRDSGITTILPDPARAAGLGLTALTAGPHAQVRHLFDRGHRRLAYAGSPDHRLAHLDNARGKAVRTAAAQLGLAAADLRAVDYRDGSAERAVREWHADGVSGVAAFDDHTAACVVGAAVRAGLAVPGDLAVVGHGDSPQAATYLPAISTVKVDYAGMARHLAESALHEADGRPLPPGDIDIATTVVPREST
jgi:DNA-binding LacI/PurR family transcriptional regulator